MRIVVCVPAIVTKTHLFVVFFPYENLCNSDGYTNRQGLMNSVNHRLYLVYPKHARTMTVNTTPHTPYPSFSSSLSVEQIPFKFLAYVPGTCYLNTLFVHLVLLHLVTLEELFFLLAFNLLCLGCIMQEGTNQG